MRLLHLFSIVVFLVFSHTIAAQGVLQYNLKKDDTFKIYQHANQLITQDINGMIQEVTNDFSGIIQLVVSDTSKNGYIIEMTYLDLKLKMSSNLEGLLMDVNAKDTIRNSIETKMFNAMLNHPVVINMAKTGDILSVTKADKLIDRMLDATDIEDEFTLSVMRASLETNYSSDSLSESFKQMTYFYSGQTIAVNDSWTNTYTGKLATENIWQLKSWNKEEASLTASADAIMKTEQMGVSMHLTGQQKTAVTIDATSGFLNEMTVEGTFNGNSVIALIGDDEIPTTITSKTTFQRIK
ncbi:DUF6263 family protein [Leptobacterium sp. I13]|uniref:DUF6263 family protein n=1 Tax=Leptobacterium meishanense TaxID=3128904 RepID=UPI0030EC23DD